MKKLLGVLFLLFHFCAYGQESFQTGQNLTKSAYEGRSLYATGSIKLLPGFSTSARFTAKIGIPVDTLIDSECEALELSDTTAFKALPWFDNNQYLQTFLDSLGYPFTSTTPCTTCRVNVDGIRYRIPVKFWVYRDNNGAGCPTACPNDLDAQVLIDALNQNHRANNTGIQFYLACGVSYVNDGSKQVVTSVGSTFLGNWVTGRRKAGAINIHIVRQIGAVDANGGTTAGLYNPIVDAILINHNVATTHRQGLAATDLRTTVVHEVGHLLSLAHTHQGKAWNWWFGLQNCFKEPVDRSRTWAGISFCGPRKKPKCESTGDALCDTPADPDLGNWDLFNPANPCVYTGTLIDEYGDRYDAPPPGSSRVDERNFMAYTAQRSCRDRFSRNQIAVMLYDIERGLRHSQEREGWKSSGVVFDSFEPNENQATARTIGINQAEELNFHWQYDGFIVTPTYSACDQDWARFTVSASERIIINTAAVSGRPQPNTRLTLFNAQGTQLAQNDDANGTVFSQLDQVLTAGTYFIRVENLSGYPSPESRGWYRLNVANSCNDFATASPTISNTPINGSVCTNGATFTLQNAPAGATVSWSAGTGLTINASTGAAIPQTGFKGQVTVTATFSRGSCGSRQVSKTVQVGVMYSSSDYPVSGPTSAGCNQTVYYSTNDLPAATSYSWYWPSGWTYVSGQGTRYLTVQTGSSGSTGSVGVRVATACDPGGSPGSITTSVSCSGMMFSIYPNPANSFVDIAADETLAGAKHLNQDFEVKVFDRLAQEKLNGKTKKEDKVKKIRLDVKALPVGVYVVHIIYPGGIEQRQLQIMR